MLQKKENVAAIFIIITRTVAKVLKNCPNIGNALDRSAIGATYPHMAFGILIIVTVCHSHVITWL